MPSNETAISWTDKTWNPVHGCSKVTEGCANCYAAAWSQDMGHTEHPWTVDNVEENVTLQDHHLDFPASIDEPSRVFVNSMSDLFHPEVPDDYVHQIMDVMDEHDEHVYLALTKHGAETGEQHGEVPRLIEWEETHGRWPDTLWMGVTVESAHRTYRIADLLATSAAVKWVSFEPLIGPVDAPLDDIDWVVVGGESGPDFRPMNHAWARALRDEAEMTGTAYYFKQSAGPKQGHLPYLAEAGDDVREARWKGAGATEYRELPPALTPALRDHRPDLAAEEVTASV